jgi:hypothetical protein
MWNAVGLALCCITLGVALYKSKRSGAEYYAHEVYGMTARAHLAYARLSVLFAAAFAAAFFIAAIPAVPLLAAYALIFIFYFSSFARGFGEEP